MESFIDRERAVVGSTRADEKDVDDEIAEAKQQIKNWMTAYQLDRWSNQPKFVEVWIEKKALQGVFERPCLMNRVALNPCKGYPSLTFLNDAKDRFLEAQGRSQETVILYFGDYDPSGEDIPRSIKKNLARMGCDVQIKVMALKPELIQELNLPGVPPKSTDSRTASWDGAGAVELDAVEPNLLKELCEKSISDNFDQNLFDELKEKEEEETEVYKEELTKFVMEMQK